MRTVTALLALAALAPAAPANCDTSGIRWFVPARFKEAREAAAARKRLLILKGIAFGVDEAGARCATAGSW